MLRAASRGVINFADADPFDIYWKLKQEWLLHAVYQESARELATMDIVHWSALCAQARFAEHEGTALKTTLDNATNALKNLTFWHYPWLKAQLEAENKQSQQAVVSAWEEMYGTPGTEKYAQTMREVDDYVRAMSRPDAA